MPEQLYADVAQTTVPGGVAAAGTTSITVASSGDFPAALSAQDKEFQAAFVDLGTSPPTVLEYITVRNISGTTWTIQRATAAAVRFPAAARAAGVGIRAVLTAAVIARFIPQNRNPYHDIRRYGAVGTNDTTNAGAVDCTQAIVDAMADANLSTTETYKRDDANGSGWTYIPGNRDYKVCNGSIPTLQIPQVTKVIGGSGSGIGTGSPPTAALPRRRRRTVAEHASSAVNIVGIHLEHILLDGRSYDHVSAAGYGNGALNLFKYRPTGANAAKPDTGSQFIDVWLHGSHGDGSVNESLGMTNWLWSRGRADAIGGYPFYVRATGGAFGTIEKMTWDPGATAGRSKGFLFLDGEAETGNGKSYFTLDDLHLELNVHPGADLHSHRVEPNLCRHARSHPAGRLPGCAVRRPAHRHAPEAVVPHRSRRRPDQPVSAHQLGPDGRPPGAARPRRAHLRRLGARPGRRAPATPRHPAL